MVGTVVIVRYLMCVKISVPETASIAAVIISLPPEICIVNILIGRLIIPSIDFLTVFGISWSLRSRKISQIQAAETLPKKR